MNRIITRKSTRNGFRVSTLHPHAGVLFRGTVNIDYGDHTGAGKFIAWRVTADDEDYPIIIAGDYLTAEEQLMLLTSWADDPLSAEEIRQMAEEELCGLLDEITRTDPSADGHTGPDSPEIARRYRRRNALVWRAADAAQKAGVPVGIRWDHGSEQPVILFMGLPSGQVSWHLPDEGSHHGTPVWLHRWDGHTTREKHLRVALYLG